MRNLFFGRNEPPPTGIFFLDGDRTLWQLEQFGKALEIFFQSHLNESFYETYYHARDVNGGVYDVFVHVDTLRDQKLSMSQSAVDQTLHCTNAEDLKSAIRKYMEHDFGEQCVNQDLACYLRELMQKGWLVVPLTYGSQWQEVKFGAAGIVGMQTVVWGKLDKGVAIREWLQLHNQCQELDVPIVFMDDSSFFLAQTSADREQNPNLHAVHCRYSYSGSETSGVASHATTIHNTSELALMCSKL